jgi:hypothetical protein
MTAKTSKTFAGGFIKAAYSVALAFLLVLLLRSIAVQITPEPPPQKGPYPDVSTPELCEEAGGRWVKNAQVLRGEEGEPIPVKGVEGETNICQGPLKFEQERSAQAEKSRQTSLFVFLIGGAVAVASSAFLNKSKVLAGGFILGGIFSFFVAATQLWMLAPGLGRVITIGVLFLVLAGVGMYVFRDKDKEEEPVAI